MDRMAVSPNSLEIEAPAPRQTSPRPERSHVTPGKWLMMVSP